MKAADFLSAPEDLLPAALAHGKQLENSGWTIEIEPYDLAFPRTPFFSATRGHTTRFVEVQSAIDLAILREWARYCKACDKDTRICVVLDLDLMPTSSESEALRELGVGVIATGKAGPYQLLTPQDLAINIDPPEIPPELKSVLGEAYDLLGDGDWREGFEAACTVLEQEARGYLRLHVQRGRVVFVNAKGRQTNHSESSIDTMPMGALARVFSEIQTPNVADSRIGQALARVNRDRVTVAHHKGRAPERELELRKNVPKHMFVLVAGLRYVRGIER